MQPIRQQPLPRQQRRRSYTSASVPPTKWPELFPPCKAAAIVEQHGNRQLIEVSADANDERFTWRSLRPRTLKGIGKVPLWVLRHAEP